MNMRKFFILVACVLLLLCRNHLNLNQPPTKNNKPPIHTPSQNRGRNPEVPTKREKPTPSDKTSNFASKPWALTEESPRVVKDPSTPYQVRMDPRFEKEGRPMAIDSTTFKKGVKTMQGGIRNANEFWMRWLTEFPDTLSPENKERVHHHISPIVDEVWLQTYPEHANFKGERLIHHHLDYASYAIPLPNTVHSKEPGWSIWHYKHKGHFSNQE